MRSIFIASLTALLAACSSPCPVQMPAPAADGALTSEHQPIVILMIGDGMGAGQLDVASRYRHGEPGKLFMQSLAHRGEIRTGNLSGTTDSAAAATTMATGKLTYNTSIGLDRNGVAVETLVEVARDRGLGTGIVSTAYLSHATPASFTAHHRTRHEPEAIAADQALKSGADVMLGGGLQHFSSSLVSDMEVGGYRLVDNAADLEALDLAEQSKVIGLFADEHLDYVVDRTPDTTQPTLSLMSTRSLELLEARERGFFLMIEGARIDMASHDNDLERTIAETLAFDDAVRAVHEWAEGKSDVTIVVTADHECGGLELVSPAPVGTLPEVRWRWDIHTNARVPVFAEGPKSELFDATIRDHRWVHASLLAAIHGNWVAEPERELVADGYLGDLRYQVAEQQVESGFGVGVNQLHALRVDANGDGLAIGVEGIYEWDNNALVVLIDTDFGSESGATSMDGLFGDQNGVVDEMLSNLRISASPEGFGAEFALVSHGGMDPHEEDRWDDAGLRGLVSPHGASHDLGWHGAAVNFGEKIRSRGEALEVAQGEGFESFIRWSTLFPEAQSGTIPAGAKLGISVLLVNSDGSYISNQALPAFEAGSANPGAAAVRLPGIIAIGLDADLDGVVDASIEAGSVID